jgi:two-component system, cell cycle response regulator
MGGTKSREPPRAAAATVPDSGVVPRLWDEEPEPSTTNQTGAMMGPKPARSFKRPALIVMAGSAAGRVFPLQGEKVTVGRSKQAAFSLDDQGISRMHCGIACKGGTYFLSDLGSTNGTLVNGGRTDQIELHPGDRIQIGPRTVLQFDFYDEAEGGLVSKLYEAATRDLLTGALNNRALQERLIAEVAYAVRHRAKLVAVAVDIDDLATITDAHGDAAGDAVLTGVAGAIATTLRGEDLFARVGGPSFVVLGRGLSLRKGAKVADRIRKLVDERVFEHQAHRLNVSLSTGVAELAETGRSGAGEELMQLANQRLTLARDAVRAKAAAKA